MCLHLLGMCVYIVRQLHDEALLCTLLAELAGKVSKGWRSCPTKACACGCSLRAEESARAPAERRTV